MIGLEEFAPALANLAPYHLLFYSTLLGTSIYQSFVVVKTVHRALPQPAFITLQGRLFPIYFRIQTLCLFLTSATFPPHGPISLVKDRTSAVLFSVAGLGTLLNLLVYGPRTRQAMFDRNNHKAAQDTIHDQDLEQAREEVAAALNKTFHKSHVTSLHLNLITIGAMAVYGWRLALRFN